MGPAGNKYGTEESTRTALVRILEDQFTVLDVNATLLTTRALTNYWPTRLAKSR